MNLMVVREAVDDFKDVPVILTMLGNVIAAFQITGACRTRRDQAADSQEQLAQRETHPATARFFVGFLTLIIIDVVS